MSAFPLLALCLALGLHAAGHPQAPQERPVASPTADTLFARAEAMRDDALVAAFRESMIRVENLEGGFPFLGRMVAGKRIVAIGEDSHGNEEFARARTAMLAELVGVGFRVLMIEANAGHVAKLDAYARGDASVDVDSAVRGPNGTSVYGYTAMADMFRWIRKFNAGRERADMVRVVGIDVTDIRGHLATLRTALGKGRLRGVAQSLKSLDAYLAGTTRDANPLRPIRQAQRAVAEIGAALEAKSANGVGDLRIAVDSIDQALAFDYAEARLGIDTSTLENGLVNTGIADRAMAANVRNTLNLLGKDTRAIILAHNAHLNRGGLTSNGGYRTEMMMGAYLSMWYGKDYFVVGQKAGRGEATLLSVADYEARRLKRSAQSLGVPQAGSLEALLERASPTAMAFVPMAGMARHPLAVSERIMGTVMAEGLTYTSIPAQSYDAVLFVPRVTGVTYLTDTPAVR